MDGQENRQIHIIIIKCLFWHKFKVNKIVQYLFAWNRQDKYTYTLREREILKENEKKCYMKTSLWYNKQKYCETFKLVYGLWVVYSFPLSFSYSPIFSISGHPGGAFFKRLGFPWKETFLFDHKNYNEWTCCYLVRLSRNCGTKIVQLIVTTPFCHYGFPYPGAWFIKSLCMCVVFSDRVNLY